jgi:capsular polysaccharide biosynthesis protein
MTDRDPQTMGPLHANGLRGPRLAAFDDFAFPEDQPADVAAGLVSLGYVWSAIKRRARFWSILAIIGLLIGVGYYVKSPPSYKASTSVLLTYGPDESPASAVFDNQTIAESHSVAQLAMKKLGIDQSVGSFASAYTVAVITDRVLQITASAPSASAAVSRASAIASAFLQYRASEEETAQKVLIQSLDQEAQQARQNVANLKSQVDGISAQQQSPDQQATLQRLRNEESQAAVTEGVLEQTVAGAEAGSSTISAVTGSVVLDPAAPLAHSKLKGPLTYSAYGLLGGLALGLAIVVIGAVTSDKLRRRDDIARALGAPTELSVGVVRTGRRSLRGRRGLEASDDIETRRIAAYLRRNVPVGQSRATLAVVAVDDPYVAALSLVRLATSFADEGRQVVLADLAVGAPAAGLLGSEEPGVRLVGAGQTRLALAVPEPGELAPVGPLNHGSTASWRSDFGDEVARVCASADVVLTLVTLKPALGAAHLPTWASRAIAMVTAGRSSWTQAHAAGEMIRLSGIPLTSVVVVGADQADQTLGAAPPEALLGIGDVSL